MYIPIVSRQDNALSCCLGKTVPESVELASEASSKKLAKVIALRPLTNAPDHLLQELFCAGVDQAFTILYYRYRPYICNWVRIISNKEIAHAEDIAQDVFLKLSELGQKITGIENLENYLYYMVKNILIGEKHKAVVREKYCRYVQQNALPCSNTTEQALFYKEAQKAYDKSIQMLPNQIKRAQELKEDGLKTVEIAKSMGISQSSVKTHLQRATKKIRAFISQEYS